MTRLSISYIGELTLKITSLIVTVRTKRSFWFPFHSTFANRKDTKGAVHPFSLTTPVKAGREGRRKMVAFIKTTTTNDVPDVAMPLSGENQK